MQSTAGTPQSIEERSGFVGRVQEQRQFLMSLQGLLAHHQRWIALSKKFGADFNFSHAPGDDSYANIFLPHGIGGIGKSWLTRRCLALSTGIPSEPSILTLYDDVSLGAPVLEPGHLLDRLATQLEQAGYGVEIDVYRQAKANTPNIVNRVTRYQFENREQWDKLVNLAADLVARAGPETGYQSFAQTSFAYTHATGAETAGQDAPTLAKAYDLLLEQMQKQGKLKPQEAALFRNPPAAQAKKLVFALKQIALQQPLVIGLDNLEIVVPLEPLIRDSLVMPTNQSPLIWILSGRYNLADERVVELKRGAQIFKGYRDLLGENPPLVWNMSIFGDADLRDFLEAETERRRTPLLIDDDLVEAIKVTSSGVPLVVEMVADALFTMDRDDFLQQFALDDRNLLPDDRLNKITGRFLRYCLTHADDMERVQAMALLRKGTDEQALTATWRLPAGQSVNSMLRGLRMRYAFVLPGGLHDAVYDFVRRQLRTSQQESAIRERLSRRAVDHYQHNWDDLHDSFTDFTLRIRDPRWQRATRDLLNALLWNNPDKAVLFLLPRFVEGLGFDRAFSNGLLMQAEEFLSDSAAAFSTSYATLLHKMRVGLQDINWTFDQPGEAIGAMLKSLLNAPGLLPLHLAILHLWRGNWLVENGKLDKGLKTYRKADEQIPEESAGLRQQLGKAYYEISSRFLWPETAAEAIPSESGLLAAQRATELDPENGGAWFNYGVALDYQDLPSEAIPAYEKAIDIEARPNYYNSLGDAYSSISCDDDAIAAYRQALALDPTYAWPYHNLGLIHADQGDYKSALKFYQQALEHHQYDKDRAVSWDNFGDAHAVMGNYEEAISAYRWAGVLSPEYASPWYGLGNVYSKQERYSNAIDAYQKVIMLDPGHAWARHKLGLIYADQGNYAGAIPYYQQAIKHHEKDQSKAVSWNSLGNVYNASERPHDAIEAYRQAIKLDPTHAKAWANLGDIYILLDNTDSAVNAYLQAVELNPNLAAPWNSLGNIYASQDQDDEAIDAYQRVIKLEPDYAWAYNNLGFIHSRCNQFDKARKYYRQALEHHVDDESRAVSWSNLGDAQLALENPEEAIKAYQQATVLAPDYAWPYHNLGQVYQSRGEYDMTIGLYRQAIDRHTSETDRAVTWFNLADTHQILGRHEEAISIYQKVLAVTPKDAEAWNNLGDSYRGQEQFDEAFEAFQRAIRLDANYALPYHSLGLLVSRSGDDEAALRYFRDAINLHEDDLSRAISLSSLGDSYTALNMPEQAIQSYHEAIELTPDFARPYHRLGAISESRGEYDVALSYYRQAADRYLQDDEYQQEQSRLWNSLGNVYQVLERPTEAVSAYQRATEFDKTFAAPWSNLGDVHRITFEKNNEAVSYYEQAIEVDPDLPYPYYSLGLIYEQRADYQASVPCFRQALNRFRLSQEYARSQALNHLGNAYKGLAQYDPALDVYQQSIALEGNHFEPWVSLGSIYTTLKQYNEAINAYQQAVELDPTAALPWNNLGDIYYTLNRYPEAIEAYRQAILLDPTKPHPYYSLGTINETLKNYAPAIDYYEQAIGRYLPQQKHEQALGWTGLANIYRVHKQNEQASEAYRQAIELDPVMAPPYHSLGLIDSETGRYESAIIHYRQALDRYTEAITREERAICWNDLGYALGMVQRYDEAIDAYRHACNLNIGYAMPWYNLGNVYRVTGRWDDAAHAYGHAISLDSDYAWSYNNLAIVHEHEGDPKQAINLYRQAIDKHTRGQDKAISWKNLGDVYQTLQQYDEAVNAYQQAIEFDPRYARPWKSLGDTYRAQHRVKGVAEAYQHALNLDPAYAWPYHSLGLIYKESGEYAKATDYYEQAIKRHQHDTDRAVSWNGLGNVYLALSQYEPAIDAYQQAFQINPDNAWPYHNLGFIYQKLNSPRRSIGLYLQAIDRFDDDRHKSVSWNNLGNVYTVLGRNDSAISAYETAIALNQTYALPWNSLGETYARLGKPEDAVKAYQEAILRYSNYVLAWNNLGDVYWQLNRYQETVQAYRKAISLDNRYAWPYHNLGLVYDERGDYESALKYYQLAIERHTHPEYKAALCDKMGDLYRIMGETDKAIEQYRQAANFDPAYASPWYSLGNIYAGLEQDEDATAAYRRAILLKPEDPWPYHNLAVVYEKREVYSEAIALYQAAIDRHCTDKDRAVSWDSLGNIYSHTNRLDAEHALHAFKEAIRLNPEYALPWNSLGDVYHLLGDYQQAVGSYQKAISLDPNYVWAYNNLGTVYESMGQHQLAIDIYQRVIDHRGDHPDVAVSWNSLGDLYDSLQRETEAITAYEEAIKLDPDYTWPYNRLGTIYERHGDSDRAFALYRQATRRHRQRTTTG